MTGHSRHHAGGAHLHALIAYFRRQTSALEGYRIRLLPSATPIQPLVIGDGDEATLLSLAAMLEANDLWCGVIRPSTVPAGSARLRITLSATHRLDDVDRLLTTLENCLHKLPRGAAHA